MNPLINAVTVVLGEQVLEAAKAADRAVAGGGDLPPLHGVPFTVKENIDLAGTPTTVGLRAPVLAEPVRVALVVGPAGQVSADQVQDGVRKAASALEERVGIITPIDPR